ncbi:MAG: aldehyde dehydrogenase family protein, partial [Betaproteobacteria bacterium]
MQFELETMNAVFALQKDLSKKPQALSFEHRQAQLHQLLDFVRDKRADIQTAINADFETRSAHETLGGEIMTSALEIQHTLRHLKTWMKDTRVGVPFWLKPGKARIMHQALGCVGIIVPWNYPLYLALSPMCSALAAGNRVMIKMSEHTPHFSAFFKEEMDRMFSNEEVHVVTGGRDVAQVFSHLPFDHLLFTGSSSVGKEVMKACATNLTPVTLELGGKSPAVLT